MKKLFFAIATAAVCSSLAFASFGSKDAGTSTAQFLKLGAGARAAGMGEAFAGMADDSTSIYWNPAGLVRARTKSLSMMHAAWFEEMSYDWLSYSMPVQDFGVFGLAAQYMSYGNIIKMDDTGLAGDTINPSDTALSLSYARDLKFAGLGINLKYISSKIEHTATATGVDIGILRALMEDKLYIGLAAQNIGTKMKFIDMEDPLPMNVKLGGAYALAPSCKIALDINAPADNDVNFSLGSEYRFTETIALRAGYNTVQDLDALSGLSAGLGIKISQYIGFDYAWTFYGDLGTTHRYSLNVRFGQEVEKKVSSRKVIEAKKEQTKETLPSKQQIIGQRCVITGTVTDIENNPIPGALVKLIKNGKEILVFNASEYGWYKIRNIVPGNYVMGFWQRGYKGIRKPVVIGENDKAIEVNIALTLEK
ncbi:MAG: PorV/PorQ family protein [Elusimicrobia bacterium]|nr:PorV/PorQ family protein [Candidatus Liberimonas magnetica]